MSDPAGAAETGQDLVTRRPVGPELAGAESCPAVAHTLATDPFRPSG